MPFIIPPPSFDAPAIIRAASHSPGSPIPAQRPAIVPRHIEQPAAGGQGPDIITPAPALPRQSSAPTATTRPPVTRPDGTGQGPQ